VVQCVWSKTQPAELVLTAGTLEVVAAFLALLDWHPTLRTRLGLVALLPLFCLLVDLHRKPDIHTLTNG
jgi:hypothetical protein